MYDNIEDELMHILEVVNKCPDEFKAKCFEILLQGYVESVINGGTPKKKESSTTQAPVINDSSNEINPEILQRFKFSSKRLGIDLDRLLALFDFASDPFTLHAFKIPGDNAAVQARNVALVVAAKSYFAIGTWVADWKEVKAQCVNHNCYTDHHGEYMKNGAGSIFKTVETGKPIELSADGIREAESLLKAFTTVE